jgi:hypothetical protein
MSDGWLITCGKCEEVAPASQWLDSQAVLVGKCHFECPACGQKIRRKTVGIKRVIVGSEFSYFPETIVIEEVA